MFGTAFATHKHLFGNIQWDFTISDHVWKKKIVLRFKWRKMRSNAISIEATQK